MSNEARTYGTIVPATKLWRVRLRFNGGNVSLMAEFDPPPLSCLAYAILKVVGGKFAQTQKYCGED